jgi:hypothetical protein
MPGLVDVLQYCVAPHAGVHTMGLHEGPVVSQKLPAAQAGVHVAAATSGGPPSGMPMVVESPMPVVESSMPIVESPMPVVESGIPPPLSVIDITTAASGKSIAIMAAEGGATPASVLTLEGGAEAIIPPLAMPVTSVVSAQNLTMLASTAHTRPCVPNKLQSPSVVHKFRQR